MTHSFPTPRPADLQAAAEGARLWTRGCDGSGGQGPCGVSAVLSRRLPAGAPVQLPSPLLDDVPAWHVNLAFYGPEPGVLVPEQEQNLRLFANGVVEDRKSTRLNSSH